VLPLNARALGFALDLGLALGFALCSVACGDAPTIGDAMKDSASPPSTPDAPRAEAAPSPAAIPTSPTAPWFTDATAEAGLDFFHHEGEEQWDIRPTMGPGVAWADVDLDGDSDLFVVGGSEQAGALFLNDGRGHFSEQTAAWGLAPRGAGMGACFADLDGDGDSDLFVSADGPDTLWRNDGGRFSDVTAEAGIDDPRWGASVAAADVDGDLDVDLFVTNYLEFDLSAIPPDDAVTGRRREDPIAMLPYVFPGQADVLWRNEGSMRFVDATERAGLLAPDGKGLGCVFVDLDEDGAQDLYVANDTTPNTLWHNDGRGRFEEQALHRGLDDPRGCMGIAPADIDDDGDCDLFVSNWQTEANALYRNNLRHLPSQRRFMPAFEDIAVRTGLGQASVGYVGWGCVLADLDTDGDKDLVVANGYTSPDYETTMQCVGQRCHLYENTTPPGSLREHKDAPRWELLPPALAGAWAARELAWRGLAAADADDDGDLDLALTANNGPLVFLRNERGARGAATDASSPGAAVRPRALAVHLRGRSPNTGALGARLELRVQSGPGGPTRTLVEWVLAGGSYLSQHAAGVHFGLGDAQALELLVRWPDGRETRLPIAPGTRRLDVEQPAS